MTTIPAPNQIISDPRYADLAKFLTELNSKWEPHDKQKEIGRSIFVEGARRVFVECGRKFGKSDIAIDICWRLGNMIRGGQGYYFCAYAKAAREIVWAPQRLQGHGPQEYIKEINKTEMRVTFTSDTFVKCEGADEFKLSKGFNPDFVVLDEFADYSEEFWTAMSPNFLPKDTIVVIISSPPWELESEPGKPVIFVRIADLWKQFQDEAKKKKEPTKYRYFNYPSTCNPHTKGDLDEIRRELIALNMEDTWEREYMARRVVGGGQRIVGTFARDRHVYEHDWLIKEKIERDIDSLTWVTGADPGSSSVFAGLVVAINNYTKEVFFLDEVYEREQDFITTRSVWPKIEEKENELFPLSANPDPHRFDRVCDEAARWFMNEVLDNYGVHFDATDKATNSWDFGIGLLRDIFACNLGFISDRCEWLIWELENWRKNSKGQVKRENNHLIDTGRYCLHRADYNLTAEQKAQLRKLHPVERRLAEQRSMREVLMDVVSAGTLEENDHIGYGGEYH